MKCAVHVSWTQGMTMPDDQSHTAQLEVKLLQSVEGGNYSNRNISHYYYAYSK